MHTRIPSRGGGLCSGRRPEMGLVGAQGWGGGAVVPPGVLLPPHPTPPCPGVSLSPVVPPQVPAVLYYCPKPWGGPRLSPRLWGLCWDTLGPPKSWALPQHPLPGAPPVPIVPSGVPQTLGVPSVPFCPLWSALSPGVAPSPGIPFLGSILSPLSPPRSLSAPPSLCGPTPSPIVPSALGTPCPSLSLQTLGTPPSPIIPPALGSPLSIPFLGSLH